MWLHAAKQIFKFATKVPNRNFLRLAKTSVPMSFEERKTITAAIIISKEVNYIIACLATSEETIFGHYSDVIKLNRNVNRNE